VRNEFAGICQQYGIGVANVRTGRNSFGAGSKGQQRLQASLDEIEMSEEALAVLREVANAIRESHLITDRHQFGSWVALYSEPGVKPQFPHTDFTDDALTKRNPTKDPDLLPYLGKRARFRFFL
jgi:hypothetical protein